MYYETPSLIALFCLSLTSDRAVKEFKEFLLPDDISDIGYEKQFIATGSYPTVSKYPFGLMHIVFPGLGL